MGIGLVVLAGGAIYERNGYLAVTTVCAVMTAVVAVLLATHIVEPGKPSLGQHNQMDQPAEP
jgi:uncharacterized membrane protein YoaK (UPF0700 family)